MPLLVRTCLVLAVVLVLGSPHALRADASADAVAFVTVRGDEMLGILDAPAGLTRRDEFSRWLDEVFDLEMLATLALGPYGQGASEAQLAAYREAFATFIVVTYEARFDTFSGYSFQVGQARPMNNQDIVVRTAIIDPAGSTIPVDFRIRPANSGFHVIDIAVEGLSMLKTQRDEFAAVVQRSGLDGLIASLNARTAAVSGDN